MAEYFEEDVKIDIKDIFKYDIKVELKTEIGECFEREFKNKVKREYFEEDVKIEVKDESKYDRKHIKIEMNPKIGEYFGKEVKEEYFEEDTVIKVEDEKTGNQLQGLVCNICEKRYRSKYSNSPFTSFLTSFSKYSPTSDFSSILMCFLL